MAWNRSSTEPKKQATQRSASPWLWCLFFGVPAVVMAVALLGVLRSSPHAEDVHLEKKTSRQIASVKPQRTERQVAVEEAAPEVQPAPADDDSPSAKAQARKRAFLMRAVQDPGLMFAMTNVVSEEERARRDASRTFKTPVEQVMNWIFNCKVGLMPPLPPMEMSEAEIRQLPEILDRQLEIGEGDTEERAMRKMAVQEAKDELKKYLAEGGNPNDFLRHYYWELRKAFDLRNDGENAIRKAMSEEDPEVARSFYKQVNEHLQEKGIEKVKLAEDEEDALGITEESNKTEERN